LLIVVISIFFPISRYRCGYGVDLPDDVIRGRGIRNTPLMGPHHCGNAGLLGSVAAASSAVVFHNTAET